MKTNDKTKNETIFNCSRATVERSKFCILNNRKRFANVLF